MNEKNVKNKPTGRFAMQGTKGFVSLLIIAILAFFLGGLFFGGDSGQKGNGSATSVSEKEAKPTIWTCSMHPQIKLPKPGKCPICSMDLIPLDTGSDDDELGPRQIRLSETAKELARLETTPVVRDFAEAEIRMVGKIAYDETRLSYITAWVGGRLDRLYVDYTGVRVKKGDHMVYMYSPELLATQEELLQARTAITALSNSSSSVLKSTADATLIASREKLRLFGLSDEQINNVETSGEITDHITINAPIGGVVVHKTAQEGMYVKTGTRIYTIADLSKLWVMLEAYESDLPWLRYGQRVTFTSPSFPGETFDAVISFIDPTVNPKTRTVRVRAIVGNKKMLLKPDMFVRGIVHSRINGAGDVVDENLVGKWIAPMHPEIVKNHPGQCEICGMDLVTSKSLGYAGKIQSDSDLPLLIPASAPMITGRRAVVYIEIPNDDGPLFEGREVILGARAGDFYVVESGLVEGDLVVTNGAFKIDSELQIRAKPSMMSPSGGAPPPGHNHGQAGSSGKATMSADEMSSMKKQEEKENHTAVMALTPVYDAYFELQMSLASDDFDAAVKAAKQIKNEAGKVDMTLFSRKGHSAWMKLSTQLSDEASKVAKSDDIKAVRAVFIKLARAIININDAFGHADGKDYYLTFCPMADSNKGANWLQTVDTVYNSFFGLSMQRCGEIQKTLSAESMAGTN